MRTLYESLLDDEEVLMNNLEDVLRANKYVEQIIQWNGSLIKDKISVNNDGTILINNTVAILWDVPKHIRIKTVSYDSRFLPLYIYGEIEDMESIKDVGYLYFQSGSSIKKTRKINTRMISIQFNIKNYDWIPDELSYLFIRINDASIGEMLKGKKIGRLVINGLNSHVLQTIDLNGCDCTYLEIYEGDDIKTIKNISCFEFSLQDSPHLQNIENIQCKADFKIENCRDLISLKDIKCKKLSIIKCPKLETLEGDNSIDKIQGTKKIKI